MESRKSCELDLKILKTTNQFSLWMYNGVLHTRSILKYSRAAGFLTRSKPTKSPGSTRRRNKPLNPPQSSVLMSLCNYLVINTSFWKKKTKNSTKIPLKKTHAVFLILSQHFQTDPSVSSLADSAPLCWKRLEPGDEETRVHRLLQWCAQWSRKMENLLLELDYVVRSAAGLQPSYKS